MKVSKIIWDSPVQYLRSKRPDFPIAFFSPQTLQNKVQEFTHHFPGLVTYALKANPDSAVLSNLIAAGIDSFDVASPPEMDQVRRLAPKAVLHYNNPVRSNLEIAHAVKMNVASYSVDSNSELEKLAAQVPIQNTEIAVRFKLPVKGAAYDFGSKFGADPKEAISLLSKVKSLGYTPALTFHPGTQCTQPGVWRTYIIAAAKIATDAGVTIARLNVGGGFPSHRIAKEYPHLRDKFEEIASATALAFGENPPELVCEPGRAIVADAYCLATRVKAIRDDNAVFLNDGIYGGLSECLLIGPLDRLEVFSSSGKNRTGALHPRTVFGPTCDSVDKLNDTQLLPDDLTEEDYVIFHGLGAYSTSLTTRFNGYGVNTIQNVMDLSDNIKV
ncbi:MAG: type III PLP-dependent enzyme [Devosiaceae bacterium]|nr:type III PLP-dependent enzyme [Devosiaceae bacterium]